MAPEVVRSRTNPLFRTLREARDRVRRGELCLVEGPKLLSEALAAGAAVRIAALTPESATRERVLLAALTARGVETRLMSADLVSALSPADASQGVVALAARPRWEAEALFPPGRIALLVVALGVQDPGNVGALFRSAEAAGATGMVLGDGTADPFAWKALRGSMGSAFRLPHLRTGGTDALALLRRHGVRLLAAAADAPRPLWETDLGGALAILVGAEGRGLPPAVRAAADLAVRIPMAAPVESLNVGVAAAVLLYEAARQRLTSAGGRGKGDRPPAGAR